MAGKGDKKKKKGKREKRGGLQRINKTNHRPGNYSDQKLDLKKNKNKKEHYIYRKLISQ